MKRNLLILIFNLFLIQFCLAGSKVSITVYKSNNGIIAFTTDTNGTNISGAFDLNCLNEDLITFNVNNTTNLSIKMKLSDATTTTKILSETPIGGNTNYTFTISCKDLALTPNKGISFKLPQRFSIQFYDTNQNSDISTPAIFNFNTLKKDTIKQDNKSGKSSYNVAGIELLDAITLVKYIKLKYEPGVVLPILEYYTTSDTLKTKLDNLAEAMKYYTKSDNKFMVNIIKSISINDPNYLKDASGKAESGTLEGVLSSAETTVSNLDVTNISDAVAQVIVAQFKEDLTEIFFKHFQDALKATKFKDAKLAFPNTWNVLNDIDKDIYNYKKYLTDIRTAFKQDLNRLPLDLQNVINKGDWNSYFGKHLSLRAACLSSLYFANGMIQKTQPGKLIEDYPVSDLDTLKNTNLTSSVKFIQRVSKSVRSGSGSKYWTSLDTVSRLKNDVVLSAYLGLLYQNAGDITFMDKDKQITLRSIINSACSITVKFQQIRRFIIGVSSGGAIVAENIKAISNDKSSDKTLATTDLYNSINGLVDSIATINLLTPMLPIDTSNITKYTRLMKDGCSIAADVNKGEYSLILLKVMDIYNLTLADSMPKDGLASFINKYGDFVGLMVEADNKDAVKSALQQAITGSGGSIVKQEHRFSFAINSYIGGLYSWYSTARDNNNKPVTTTAFTTPIGFSINVGICDLGKQNRFFIRNITAFASLFDIGALAAFRMNNDSTQSIPKTTLGNIIAPGLHFIFGRLFNSPVSIGIGYQMAPHLRSLSANSSTVSSENVWQWQGSLTWDIPFFYLGKSNKTLK